MKSGSALHSHLPLSPRRSAPEPSRCPKQGLGWGFKKSLQEFRRVPAPSGGDVKTSDRPGGRGPWADQPLPSPDVPFPQVSHPVCLSTTVTLLPRSSPAVSAGMRKPERGRRGTERVGGGTRGHASRRGPRWPECGLPWWRVRARPPCACGLPLRASLASGVGDRRGSGRPEPKPGRARVRIGRAVSPGRAGPVSPAPCPQRRRREAQDARWPGGGGAAFLAAGLRPGRHWALGAGPAAACRPRTAAAAGGRTDGKGRGSCQRVAGPLRWRNLLFLPRLAGALLSLSLSLTLSLPGWKFPLTSREQTDRRTHARTQRGREVGSPPGVGEARTSGGAKRPGLGLAAQLAPTPEDHSGVLGYECVLGGLDAGVPCGAPLPGLAPQEP